MPAFTWLVPLVAPVDIRTSDYTKGGHQVGAMSATTTLPHLLTISLLGISVESNALT